MKKMLRLKRIYLLLLLPLSFVLIYVAKQSNDFAEQFFALHIYKWLSQAISMITSIFPFSIAEVLILILPIIFLFLLIQFIIKYVKEKEKRTDRLWKGILNTLCTVSIAVFLFVVLAGINYYRYPFRYYSNLELRDSSVHELYVLTKSLAMEANQLREMTETDDNGVFQLSMSMHELAEQAAEAMSALSKEYPVLAGNYNAPKPVLSSSLMSHTEITGIFIPYTMEANVNVDIPDYSIPSTMLHELAHLRGFMREDEANFIAYLAGMESDHPEINYSSTMLALIISGNALYAEDTDLYFEIRDRYSVDVLNDIRANSRYWQRYEDTVVSTVSNKINDTYLKVNDQSDGVKSYGRMVDLLLAKYREENTNEMLIPLNDNSNEMIIPLQ